MAKITIEINDTEKDGKEGTEFGMHLDLQGEDASFTDDDVTYAQKHGMVLGACYEFHPVPMMALLLAIKSGDVEMASLATTALMVEEGISPEEESQTEMNFNPPTGMKN